LCINRALCCFRLTFHKNKIRAPDSFKIASFSFSQSLPHRFSYRFPYRFSLMSEKLDCANNSPCDEKSVTRASHELIVENVPEDGVVEAPQSKIPEKTKEEEHKTPKDLAKQMREISRKISKDKYASNFEALLVAIRKEAEQGKFSLKIVIQTRQIPAEYLRTELSDLGFEYSISPHTKDALGELAALFLVSSMLRDGEKNPFSFREMAPSLDEYVLKISWN
jgi:hypothetical protein